SPLFPYTTLFRSPAGRALQCADVRARAGALRGDRRTRALPTQSVTISSASASGLDTPPRRRRVRLLTALQLRRRRIAIALNCLALAAIVFVLAFASPEDRALAAPML